MADPAVKILPGQHRAFRLSGRKGNNAVINGDYKPTAQMSNGRPVYIKTSGKPGQELLYLHWNPDKSWSFSGPKDVGTRNVCVDISCSVHYTYDPCGYAWSPSAFAVCVCVCVRLRVCVLCVCVCGVVFFFKSYPLTWPLLDNDHITMCRRSALRLIRTGMNLHRLEQRSGKSQTQIPNGLMIHPSSLSRLSDLTITIICIGQQR